MGYKTVNCLSNYSITWKCIIGFNFYIMNNYYIAMLTTISINRWFGIIKA